MKEKILELRRLGKTYNEIHRILKCAKSTISYHCAKEGLGEIRIINILNSEQVEKIKELYISNISKKLLADMFNVSEYEIKKYTNNLKRNNRFPDDFTRKQKNVVYVTERRRKLKELAIEYKGGKCTRCNYNKSKSALEFHHLDPSEKEFGIGSGDTKSWQKLKLELEKCILVCANCHREIHEEIRLSGEKESQKTVNL